MRTDDIAVTFKSHPVPEHSNQAPLGSSALMEMSEEPHSCVRVWSLQLTKENKQLLEVKVTSLHSIQWSQIETLKLINCVWQRSYV